MYLTIKYHLMNIRITGTFRFSTRDIHCFPDNVRHQCLIWRCFPPLIWQYWKKQITFNISSLRNYDVLRLPLSYVVIATGTVCKYYRELCRFYIWFTLVICKTCSKNIQETKETSVFISCYVLLRFWYMNLSLVMPPSPWIPVLVYVRTTLDTNTFL